VRVGDGGDARQRGLVGDDVGLGGAEVIDRGGHVAGVPDLDGVDEQLEAEGVAAVIVFVGGDLGAGADDEVAAQRVQGLALVELAGDPSALCGIGAVGEQEVGAHDPAVLPERGGQRRLGRRVLKPGDQQAGGDPAALERSGGSKQIVVMLADELRAGSGAQHRVNG
jgi:hypothetical protein